jgi:hypothetical protein
MRPKRRILQTVFAAALVGTAGLVLPSLSAENRISGEAFAPGTFTIAGQAVRCGQARTLVSSELNDYGASVPGVIVLNPQRLRRLAPEGRLFVYAHECGHQIHGRSEAAADCHAARQGRREGWLTSRGIAGICNVFPKSMSSGTHAARGARCAVIRACFAGTASPSQMAGSTSYEAAARGFIGR